MFVAMVESARFLKMQIQDLFSTGPVHSPAFYNSGKIVFDPNATFVMLNIYSRQDVNNQQIVTIPYPAKDVYLIEIWMLFVLSWNEIIVLVFDDDKWN